MRERKCVFFLADGARMDVFEHLLERGELENVGKYVVSPGKFLKGVTVFPSTTGPAYTPYLLGRFPGRCNLPGIRWFDRRRYGTGPFSLRGFRSYAGPESVFMNGDIESPSPTLFGMIPGSVSILNEITRDMSPASGNRTRYLKLYLVLKSHFTDRSSSVDDAAGAILLDSLDAGPPFVFCVFPSIDSYSHRYHPFHRKVIESYRRLDAYVGLAARKLRERGELESTLFVIGSDHGLTPTHSHFDSLGFLRRRGLRPLYHTNVFRHLFDADSSVMVSGNSMAHYYFKNAAGWESPTLCGETEDLVDELCDRPEIDLVCARAEAGEVKVKSARGEAFVGRGAGGRVRYRAVSGDPLGLGPRADMDAAASLDASLDSDYPDAAVQIVQLFESPRTGDVVLSSRPGYDLRATHERPEHRGSHGSLHRDHMLVPLLVSGKTRRDRARTADIFPTILSHMGLRAPDGIDGESLFS